MSSFLSEVLSNDWSRDSTAVWKDITTLGKCYNYALRKDSLPKTMDMVISLGRDMNLVYDEIMVSFFLKNF